MSIKLITIDFWNTLFDSSGGLERNKLRLKILIEETDKLGYFINQEDLNEVIQSSWDYFNSIWFDEQRTPSSFELIEFIWKKFNFQYNHKVIQNIANKYSTTILKIPPKPVQNAVNILHQLKQKYKLAIISDTGYSPGKVLRELLKKENILDIFDSFSFSDETGFSKPHPKAFQKIFDDLNIEPKDALHIGDIERTDIVGAKQLQMKAIRFSGDTQSFIPKDNPDITIADAEVFDWNDIPEIIEKIDS